MDILGTLGLSDVKAPGDLAVGNYDGVIFQSEFVLVPARDDKPAQISHVFTYKVESGDDNNGTKKQHWFNLGKNPVDAEGNFPSSVEAVAGYESTMTEKNKQYYKEAWINLGVPEQEVGKRAPETLVGLPITFRIYNNNGYKNVALNGLRAGAPVAQGSGPAPTPFDNNVPQF